MTSQTVFVSGANGYIAQHIVDLLLKKGYHVIGQVRSAAKGEVLVKDFNNKNFSIEVVEVLEKEGAFDEALAKHPEVSVFLHTASPVTPVAEDNERDILIPAINGTKNVLKSIKKVAPQIKRVVVTSSVIAAGTFAQFEDPNYEGGETSWSNITYDQAKAADVHTAYAGSKKFAELAAWDFVKDEKPNFELSTILPALVFGPQVFESSVKNLNFTASLVANALQLTKETPIPDMTSAFIDVRDIAQAHVIAFEKEQAAGQRLVVSDKVFEYKEVVEVIKNNFKQFENQLPVVEPFSSDHKYKYEKLIDSNSKKILDLQYIPFEKTIVDSIEQVLEYQKNSN